MNNVELFSSDKAKEFTRYSFIVSLILLYGYATWCIQYELSHLISVQKCGVITYKDKNIHGYSKHSYTEYIFVVDYETYGKEDITVNPSTYSSFNIGDHVCFTYTLQDPKISDWQIGFGRLGIFTNIALVIVLLFALLIWSLGI